jgi:hypothetical protein
VDEPDRNRVQEVQLLATPTPGCHQTGLLELPQVLHDTEASDLEARFEGGERLAVAAEELVEQTPPGRIGQGPEHLVHARE